METGHVYFLAVWPALVHSGIHPTLGARNWLWASDDFASEGPQAACRAADRGSSQLHGVL